MKQIITIQHTQSIQHLNGMVGSWTDWELTELGLLHAKNIGRNLSAELLGKEIKVYCSDLVRTKQTAAPLLECLGLEAEYRKELRELNLGEACGKSMKWMRENGAEVKTIDDRPFPSAESSRDVWNRIYAFCEEIISSPFENIVIVSHGHILRMWPAVWLNLGIDFMDKADFYGSAGGVSFMALTDNGKRNLTRFNDTSYRQDAAI